MTDNIDSNTCNLTLPKGYLSASSIGTYMKCGKQFEFRYVLNKVSPPKIALISGKVGHKTFETYYQEKLNSREVEQSPEEITKVAKLFSDFSISLLEKEVSESGISLVGKEKDKTIIELENAVNPYMEYVAPECTPVSVEQEIKYVTALGVPILGYIDLIREPTLWELIKGHVVSDYKFTGKKWNKNQVKDSIQFNIYSLATGIQNIEVQNLVKTKTKFSLAKNNIPEPGIFDITNNIRLISSTICENDVLHTEKIIDAVAKGISAGIFMPADPSSWICSEEWCGYWNWCRGAK